MQLCTQVDPIYFPEPDQTTVLRLGLQPLDSRNWLHIDADLPQFHAHKLEQMEIRPGSVYRTLPGSESAVSELGATVLQYLQDHQQQHYLVNDGQLSHRQSGLSWPLATDDLWQISLWVQEDLCLLQEVNGSYRLTAASVCSPSNWDPASKIGRSLSGIHGPVPGYEQELASRVDRLFSSLKADKPLLRYNWSLQNGRELFWESDPEHCPGPPTHWRIERQTLRRLPQSKAVVFTIRIFLHPLAQLSADPRFAASLHQILSALPADQKHYKGL